MLNVIERSLGAKILLVLFITVTLVITAIVCLSMSGITNQMLGDMKTNSRDLSNAIYASIKYPMKIGNSEVVEKQLLALKERVTDMEVFIIDSNQKVSFSCHEDMRGSDLSDHLANAEIQAALKNSFEKETVLDNSFEDILHDQRHFVHIRSVLNEQACYRCHGSEKKLRGAIVVRRSIEENYAAITAIRNSNIVISLLGISAIILIVYVMMSQLVSTPVSKLANDIQHLPEKISKHVGFALPEVKRKDEIGSLRDTFNQMAVELDEKTRSIEKTSDKLARANKELEAFGYSVSHDLRAPLRNIDGFSKILIDEFSDTLDARAQHYLKRVRSGTQRMSALIDDMLTFSRIGRTELVSKRVNCSAILGKILESNAHEIESRKIQVTIEKLPFIKGDPVLIESMLSNLISNALKFTRNAENPKIVVGFDDGIKAIFIRDNGIGFDMQYHDKIYQVFQRLHLPEEYEGTGIGLAIVHRVVERHDGKIWAEARLNHGAAFYMQLPLYEEA
jgi:signal transduction histidine kinase